MSGALTLALKDLKILMRDKVAVFWVLIFPVVIAVLFGAVFSGMGGGGAASKMAVAVIDRDGSEGSRDFVERLKKSTALEVKMPAEDEAREGVRRGDLVAFIFVPKGFGDANLFSPGDAPELEVGIDPSRKSESGFLQGILTEASFASLGEQFNKPDRMRAQMEKSRKELAAATGLDASQKAALGSLFGDVEKLYGAGAAPPGGKTPFSSCPKIKSVPVTHERTGPKSPFEISFPQAIVWALFSAVTSFGVSLVKERTGGTLQRLRISPLTQRDILMGKALACFLACIGVISLLLALGALFFHVRFQNPLGIALAVFCTAVGFVGIMMLLSVMGRTEQAVSGSASAILILLTMFGGGMIPLIAMPAWMIRVGSISPVKWAVLSLEGAIWRGFGLAEMVLPCGILVAVGVVCFTLGVMRLSRLPD